MAYKLHVNLGNFDQCGWQAHEDGPVYFPAASIVSLGSSAVMHFRRKSDNGEAFMHDLPIQIL